MYQYHITLDVMETIVRFGLRPNRPDLIVDYLTTLKTLITHEQVQQERFSLALRAAQLMHSAISDSNIPLAWRSMCADNIYLCIRLLQANTQSDHQETQFRIVQHQFAAITNNA
jgi:hypothetical protein